MEAQNALLKILEEPPEHTVIFLGSESTGSILPTIISRCSIKSINSTQDRLTVNKRMEYEQFLKNLRSMPIGDRLKKAENLAKNKDEALLWIEDLIIILHEKLVDPARNPEDTAGTINRFQKLYSLLKNTNVNTRFAIEQTLLAQVWYM
jgi:hypothetical protein